MRPSAERWEQLGNLPAFDWTVDVNVNVEIQRMKISVLRMELVFNWKTWTTTKSSSVAVNSSSEFTATLELTLTKTFCRKKHFPWDNKNHSSIIRRLILFIIVIHEAAPINSVHFTFCVDKKRFQEKKNLNSTQSVLILKSSSVLKILSLQSWTEKTDAYKSPWKKHTYTHTRDELSFEGRRHLVVECLQRSFIVRCTMKLLKSRSNSAHTLVH